MLGGKFEGRRHHEERGPNVQKCFAIKPGLPRHRRSRLREVDHVEHRAGASKIGMASMEERLAIRHRGVGREDAPDNIAFQRRRRSAEQCGHACERVEIVVDQHLTGDAHHFSIGLDTVAFLGLTDGAALEFAGLVDLLELRRFTKLQPLHILEIGNRRAARNDLIGPRRRLIGRTERAIGHRRKDLGEIRRCMQRAGRDLVAPHAAHADAFCLEEAARHFDQGEAAPFACSRSELVMAGLIAMQKRQFDRRAAGFDLVVP